MRIAGLGFRKGTAVESLRASEAASRGRFLPAGRLRRPGELRRTRLPGIFGHRTPERRDKVSNVRLE